MRDAAPPLLPCPALPCPASPSRSGKGREAFPRPDRLVTAAVWKGRWSVVGRTGLIRDGAGLGSRATRASGPWGPSLPVRRRGRAHMTTGSTGFPRREMDRGGGRRPAAVCRSPVSGGRNARRRSVLALFGKGSPCGSAPRAGRIGGWADDPAGARGAASASLRRRRQRRAGKPGAASGGRAPPPERADEGISRVGRQGRAVRRRSRCRCGRHRRHRTAESARCHIRRG